MAVQSHPILNQRIFWDVAFDQLDYEADAEFVIVRVFVSFSLT
jgi:hypothetical protein